MKQLEDSEVFCSHKRRKHQHFQTFKANITHKLKSKDFNEWLEFHLERLFMYMYQ